MNPLRRLLVTTGEEFGHMDLWAVFALVTNWLDCRERDGRWTWLVMFAGEDLDAFTAAAGKCGCTVEEIHRAGGDDRYELLVGAPGTGWDAP